MLGTRSVVSAMVQAARDKDKARLEQILDRVLDTHPYNNTADYKVFVELCEFCDEYVELRLSSEFQRD